VDASTGAADCASCAFASRAIDVPRARIAALPRKRYRKGAGEHENLFIGFTNKRRIFLPGRILADAVSLFHLRYFKAKGFRTRLHFTARPATVLLAGAMMVVMMMVMAGSFCRHYRTD
jgi:hypothetical protein